MPGINVLSIHPISAEDGPQDHVQCDPVHRFENPEFFILRPIRDFTQRLVLDNLLVAFEALTVKCWREQPAPFAMPTAVKPEYRPGPE